MPAEAAEGEEDRRDGAADGVRDREDQRVAPMLAIVDGSRTAAGKFMARWFSESGSHGRNRGPSCLFLRRFRRGCPMKQREILSNDMPPACDAGLREVRMQPARLDAR